MFVILALFSTVWLSCEKNTTDKDKNLVPENFAIDLPSSISSPNTLKSVNGDTLKGGDIYKYLRFFIYIGEESAKLVNGVMLTIRTLDINEPMQLDYTSADDNRAKHLVVIENPVYQGQNWEFGMTVTDQNNQALQIFWNRSPVKGIAILKASTFDNTYTDHKDMTIKVEYSEAESAYKQQMVVSITGFTQPANDIFALNNMKMFVGKNGDVIEIYGNSNHPKASFIDKTVTGGFNWAFTARADIKANIAVAAVCIPPSSLANNTNIIDTYSIENVLRAEVNKVYTGIDQALLNWYLSMYLADAKKPGYFDKNGFISSGTNKPSISGFTDTFINLSTLTPYVPVNVRDLNISFGN